MSKTVSDLENPLVLLLKARLLMKRRVDKKTGCWIWTGTTDRGGYGLIKLNGVRVLVHRLAFALWRGTVLERNQLVKTSCKNRACFCPEHIRRTPAGKKARNASRSAARGMAE